MSRQIEYEAADQIRRLMDEDERFSAVSGATAFRRADRGAGRQDAGFFSFDRDGVLYCVTVERAERRTNYSQCCACDGTGSRHGKTCDHCNGTCCSYHYKAVDPACGSCRIA